MSDNMLRVPLRLYHHLVRGVHVFAFQESTRAAVDQWIDHMDDILGVSPPNQPLGIVLDTRESGTLPLAYMTQRLRDLLINYDKRPLLRIVLISNQSALLLLIQMLAQITASDDKNVVQYYQAAEEDEAIQWLLQANRSIQTTEIPE